MKRIRERIRETIRETIRERIREIFKNRIIIFSLIILSLIAVMGVLVLDGIIWFNNPTAKDYPVRGIDVSHYQKDIDWVKVKNQGISFAFIKATEGLDFKDLNFKTNWDGARRAGLAVGAYHFYTFKRTGKEQAKNFIETVPVMKGSLPPVVDIEFSGNSKVVPNRADFVQQLTVFTDEIKKVYKQDAIFYVTYDSYEKLIRGGFKDNPIWIRDVLKTPLLQDSRPWTFWQYNDRGKIDGIVGPVDLDVFNGNLLNLQKGLSVVE